MNQREQIIAKWTDERGQNTLAGLIIETQPMKVIHLGGHGIVTVPDHANIYRPHRPEMVFVAKAADYR